MYNNRSIQEDTATYFSYHRWGDEVGSTYYRTGGSVWQVWIPEDNRYDKTGRVASESQEGRKNLEGRRIEGATEAAEEKKTMA